ncbi:MAG TPA: hypothetical protein VI933_03270 [archaeon]|nr:hypothetical protein [archaeon]
MPKAESGILNPKKVLEKLKSLPGKYESTDQYKEAIEFGYNVVSEIMKLCREGSGQKAKKTVNKFYRTLGAEERHSLVTLAETYAQHNRGTEKDIEGAQDVLAIDRKVELIRSTPDVMRAQGFDEKYVKKSSYSAVETLVTAATRYPAVAGLVSSLARKEPASDRASLLAEAQAYVREEHPTGGEKVLSQAGFLTAENKKKKS